MNKKIGLMALTVLMTSVVSFAIGNNLKENNNFLQSKKVNSTHSEFIQYAVERGGFDSSKLVLNYLLESLYDTDQETVDSWVKTQMEYMGGEVLFRKYLTENNITQEKNEQVQRLAVLKEKALQDVMVDYEVNRDELSKYAEENKVQYHYKQIVLTDKNDFEKMKASAKSFEELSKEATKYSNQYIGTMVYDKLQPDALKKEFKKMKKNETLFVALNDKYYILNLVDIIENDITKNEQAITNSFKRDKITDGVLVELMLRKNKAKIDVDYKSLF